MDNLFGFFGERCAEGFHLEISDPAAVLVITRNCPESGLRVEARDAVHVVLMRHRAAMFCLGARVRVLSAARPASAVLPLTFFRFVFFHGRRRVCVFFKPLVRRLRHSCARGRDIIPQVFRAPDTDTVVLA